MLDMDLRSMLKAFDDAPNDRAVQHAISDVLLDAFPTAIYTVEDRVSNAFHMRDTFIEALACAAAEHAKHKPLTQLTIWMCLSSQRHMLLQSSSVGISDPIMWYRIAEIEELVKAANERAR